MKVQTRELLEKLMADEVLTTENLDELLTTSAIEDLYLEYKHGKILQEKGAAIIRKYLTGFANSAGGVLVIGVDENSRSVTGCAAPGGGNLAEWASRCITPIATRFSPPPRFSVVAHSKGDVLLAATARSLNLVPCIESGSLRYYLRLNDQTLSAPEYLISDLAMGRRNLPVLDVKEYYLNNARGPTFRESENQVIQLNLNVVIENSSFSWANNVRVGLIGLFSHDLRDNQAVGPYLRSFVDTSELAGAPVTDFKLQYSQSDYGLISSFNIATRPVFRSQKFKVSNGTSQLYYDWKAALYIDSRESLPVWYQISIQFNDNLYKRIQENKGLIPSNQYIKLELLPSGVLPQVRCEQRHVYATSR